MTMHKYRKIGNFAAITAAASGAGGGVLPSLLKALNLVSLATNIETVFRLYKDPLINWTGIWVIVLIAGIAAICVINFDIVRSWWVSRKYHKPKWDFPVFEAINYIRSYSILSDTMVNAPTSRTIEAFIERAQKGQIKVMGRPVGGAGMVIIPRRDWFGSNIDLAKISDPIKSRPYNHNTRSVANLICNNEEKTLKYAGLVVGKQSVLQLWPQRSLNLGWMAS